MRPTCRRRTSRRGRTRRRTAPRARGSRRRRRRRRASASPTAARIAAISSNDRAFALPSSRCSTITRPRRSIVSASALIADDTRDPPRRRTTSRRCRRDRAGPDDRVRSRPGGRTVMPAAAITALASAMVCSPKWKIDAASTASAPPSATPSTRWSSVPTPPLAITGTPTASADRPRQLEVEAVPGAVAVHRREQDLAGAELDRPLAPTRRVDAGRRAPAVEVHLEPGDRRRGAWRRSRTRRTATPNSAAISAISSGRWTAAVLTLTLSAPARSMRRASSTVRMPPPTVNGMNTCSAVRRHHVDHRRRGRRTTR